MDTLGLTGKINKENNGIKENGGNLSKKEIFRVNYDKQIIQSCLCLNQNKINSDGLFLYVYKALKTK